MVFPLPPPLKAKSLRPSFSTEMGGRLPDRSFATYVMVLSGVLVGGFAFLACLGLYFLLRPFLLKWGVPSILLIIPTATLILAGFAFGVSTGRSFVSYLLNSDDPTSSTPSPRDPRA